MRGLARALVGLLQTGVDFTCRLCQLTTRRHDGGPSSRDGPVSVSVARNDHHDAALGQLDSAAEWRHELDATAEWRHELDATAGGLEHAAEISAFSSRYGR